MSSIAIQTFMVFCYNIQYLPALDEKQRERIAAKQAAALASED